MWQVYRDADVLLYCDTFDRGNEIEEIQIVLKRCLDAKDLDSISEIPVVLCRTKGDLNLPFKDRQRVLRWAKFHNFPFISTSAKTPTNVDLVFETACRLAFLKAKKFELSRGD